MSVLAMLDVSSKHVSKEWLESYNENDQYYFGRTKYGLIVWAPVWWDEKNVDFEHKMLFPLFKLAAENGCSYINIDVDGHIYNELPQYEWD